MEELSRGEHEARDVGSKAETAESSLQDTAGVLWESVRGTRNLERLKWTQKDDGVVGNY